MRFPLALTVAAAAAVTAAPAQAQEPIAIHAVDGDAMANLESFMNVAFVMKGAVVYKEGGQPVGRAVAR